MPKRAISLNEKLLDILEDDTGISEYLTMALEENGPNGLLLAIKNVVEAQNIKMSQLAKDADLNRENLYRVLSETGNPYWNNVYSIVEALGLKITFLPKDFSEDLKVLPKHDVI